MHLARVIKQSYGAPAHRRLPSLLADVDPVLHWRAGGRGGIGDLQGDITEMKGDIRDLRARVTDTGERLGRVEARLTGS